MMMELVPPLVASAVAVLFGVMLTGAFHEDGLADTADAMDVALRRCRNVVVHDMGQRVDVETAGGDIGSNKNVVGAIFESAESFESISLFDVRVHGDYFLVPSAFD